VGRGVLALVVVEVAGESFDFSSLQEDQHLGLVLQVDLLACYLPDRGTESEEEYLQGSGAAISEACHSGLGMMRDWGWGWGSADA
jgi:hypothetical protein